VGNGVVGVVGVTDSLAGRLLLRELSGAGELALGLLQKNLFGGANRIGRTRGAYRRIERTEREGP
jgi:hypothetical protein